MSTAISPVSELNDSDVLLATGKASKQTAAAATSVEQMQAEIREVLAMAEKAIDRQKKFNQALHAAVEKAPRELLQSKPPQTPAARRLMEMCVSLMQRYSPETVAAAHGSNRQEQVNQRLINRI